jgi:hypothetical protein
VKGNIVFSSQNSSIDAACDARFAKQELSEQRRLLNFVRSNSAWRNGELMPTFRQLFDLVAQVTATANAGTNNLAYAPCLP